MFKNMLDSKSKEFDRLVSFISVAGIIACVAIGHYGSATTYAGLFLYSILNFNQKK